MIKALVFMPEYRRRLPHIQPDGAWFSVTWRLAGSIAKCVRDEAAARLSEGQRFLAMDRVLDLAAECPTWLLNLEIADVVAQAIVAWACEKKLLAVGLKWLKGSTGYRANVMLGRSGLPFWRDESFDRWVRTAEELVRLVRYIDRNPVSAGLTSSPGLWRWSSASRVFELAG